MKYAESNLCIQCVDYERSSSENGEILISVTPKSLYLTGANQKVSKIKIKNRNNFKVYFKILSTHPTAFQPHPATGYIAPHKKAYVNVPFYNPLKPVSYHEELKVMISKHPFCEDNEIICRSCYETHNVKHEDGQSSNFIQSRVDEEKYTSVTQQLSPREMPTFERKNSSDSDVVNEKKILEPSTKDNHHKRHERYEDHTYEYKNSQKEALFELKDHDIKHHTADSKRPICECRGLQDDSSVSKQEKLICNCSQEEKACSQNQRNTVLEISKLTSSSDDSNGMKPDASHFDMTEMQNEKNKNSSNAHFTSTVVIQKTHDGKLVENGKSMHENYQHKSHSQRKAHIRIRVVSVDDDMKANHKISEKTSKYSHWKDGPIISEDDCKTFLRPTVKKKAYVDVPFCNPVKPVRYHEELNFMISKHPFCEDDEIICQSCYETHTVKHEDDQSSNFIQSRVDEQKYNSATQQLSPRKMPTFERKNSSDSDVVNEKKISESSTKDNHHKHHERYEDHTYEYKNSQKEGVSELKDHDIKHYTADSKRTICECRGLQDDSSVSKQEKLICNCSQEDKACSQNQRNTAMEISKLTSSSDDSNGMKPDASHFDMTEMQNEKIKNGTKADSTSTVVVQKTHDGKLVENDKSIRENYQHKGHSQRKAHIRTRVVSVDADMKANHNISEKTAKYSHWKYRPIISEDDCKTFLGPTVKKKDDESPSESVFHENRRVRPNWRRLFANLDHRFSQIVSLSKASFFLLLVLVLMATYFFYNRKPCKSEDIYFFPFMW